MRTSASSALIMFGVCLLCATSSAQVKPQPKSVVLNGNAGEVSLVEINGRTYADLKAMVQVANGSAGFQGDRLILELRHKLACENPSRRGLATLFVDCAHRVNIAFPNGEQVLNVARFIQGLAEPLDEFVSFGEALA